MERRFTFLEPITQKTWAVLMICQTFGIQNWMKKQAAPKSIITCGIHNGVLVNVPDVV